MVSELSSCSCTLTAAVQTFGLYALTLHLTYQGYLILIVSNQSLLAVTGIWIIGSGNANHSNQLTHTENWQRPSEPRIHTKF